MLFLLGVTPIMHNFWQQECYGEEQVSEMINFMKVMFKSFDHFYHFRSEFVTLWRTVGVHCQVDEYWKDEIRVSFALHRI